MILEWGPGFSTKFLLDNTKVSEFYAVEHDPFWHRRVFEFCEGDPRLMVVFCQSEAKTEYAEESLLGFDEYASIPDVPVDRADIIVVDGYARGACVATAAMRAKLGARLFFHDADSPNYKWAIQHMNSHPSWTHIGTWPPLPEDAICAEMQEWQRID